MIDVQNFTDNRNIEINKVGIKNLKYPIIVLDKSNNTQNTIATINMYANLPHNFKGTHMSRFIEVFNRYSSDITMKNFLKMLAEIRTTLDSETAFTEMFFPYFINKRAPVSQEEGIMSYNCQYIGKVDKSDSQFSVGIDVPITTVCPCSREISERGAHNQRGIVRVKLRLGQFFWIEDIITLIENSASSDVYSLLKREDEKMITERAYDNPMFVEDIVREVTLKLNKSWDFPWFSVEVESYESIHNHSAYAYIETGNLNISNDYF